MYSYRFPFPPLNEISNAGYPVPAGSFLQLCLNARPTLPLVEALIPVYDVWMDGEKIDVDVCGKMRGEVWEKVEESMCIEGKLSENQALSVLLLWRRGFESCHDCLIKNILQLILCQSTALHILHSSKLFGHTLAILPPHRGHLLLAQLLTHTRVLTQICLGADNQAGDARTMVVYFGEPLLAYILEGGRGSDGETNKEDIGLRVGKGT